MTTSIQIRLGRAECIIGHLLERSRHKNTGRERLEWVRNAYADVGRALATWKAPQCRVMALKGAAMQRLAKYAKRALTG